MKAPVAMILAALLFGGVREVASELFSFRQPATFKMGKERFDLREDEAIGRLVVRAEDFVVEAGRAARKKDLRGLNEIVRLGKLRSEEQDFTRREELRREICEVAAAIANNHRAPVPRYVGLPDLPFRLADAMRNPVGKGKRAATNLEEHEEGADLSRLDPVRSTLWTRPESIRGADLYAGFGRTELPRFDLTIWNYAGPKTGGAHAGCELMASGQRIKVKFAEVHSEPFNSRIFHALGFNVDATDFAPGLKVRYDRRLFQEFNTRPEMTMKIGLFFIPLYTFHFEKEYDPFEFIDHAVFRSGEVLSGGELKRMLLKDLRGGDANFLDDNFREEIEAEIDYLVTAEANVELDSKDGQGIGPWSFGGLGREDLRELRGSGVVAAWIEWFDARYDNTRLRVVDADGGRELRHYFSDLGGGLGKSRGTFRRSTEEPNDLNWSFTRGGGKRKFRIIEYEPIEDTPAFKAISLDDAKWMARLIGELSEEQIVAALVASGFESAEVRIYTEKLVARRDRLIQDTGLDGEIPMLREGGVDRLISYDPEVEGRVKIRRQGGEVEAPVGRMILREGRMEPRKP